jgi:hypothetical protein
MEMNMEPIVVSSQNQYDEALKLYWETLKKSRFDIDREKGREIVKNADRLIHNFLNGEASKEHTENDLSRFYFNQSQAGEITAYFLTRPPEGLFDTLQGLNILNILNMRVGGQMNDLAPLIHIKDSIEKISVLCPVEAFGESEIEAFGHAKVTAHDDSRIISSNWAMVKALDNSRVTAHNKSHIIAKDNSSVTLYGYSTAAVYNYARITAREDSKTAVFDQGNATFLDTARADVFDRSLVFARNDSRINAFNDVTVNAYDDSRIIAKNTAYIVAGGSSNIEARDYSVIVAGGKVKVAARCNSLVFLKDDAVCETKDKAEAVNKSQNKPALLTGNVLRLLDHPFIGRNPVIAVNLLLASADPGDRGAFSQKLKEMGCIDPGSTNKVLLSMVDKLSRSTHTARDRDSSWER